MLITDSLLHDIGACLVGVSRFREMCPKGIEAEELIRRVREPGVEPWDLDYVSWLVENDDGGKIFDFLYPHKIGETVHVRADLLARDCYEMDHGFCGADITHSMYDMRDKDVTIKGYMRGMYYLEECSGMWTDEMFEEVKNETVADNNTATTDTVPAD